MSTILVGAAQPHVGRLQQQLMHLEQTARVLYVAAHPDDENTQLLAHLTWERGIGAAYLSLTRGSGGQNLVGVEQGAALGVIRTHELLQARRLDGAQQFFTRAVDFGFSKSAEESLQVWGHEEVLADVVRIVRYFRPHVIVTRFPENGQTHGHHLASAILAREAFTASADPERFAEQLDELQPWQPTRIIYNLPFWRMDPNTDTSGFLAVDVGGYNPLLGQSYGELSAASRTMHKSQGFGTPPRVGPKMEYFTLVAGAPPVGRDPFIDIAPPWESFTHGLQVRNKMREARTLLSPQSPEAVIAPLMDAWGQLDKLSEPALRRDKRAAIAQMVLHSTGLVVRARVPSAELVPGQRFTATLECLNRGNADVLLESIEVLGQTLQADESLERHELYKRDIELTIPDNAPVSMPYWLQQPAKGGMYSVEPGGALHHPLGPPPIFVTFNVVVAGHVLAVPVGLEHARRDPLLGEVRRLAGVFPPVTLTPEAEATVIPNGNEQRLTYTLRALAPKVQGVVVFSAPAGFSLQPQRQAFELMSVGDVLQVSTLVTAPKEASQGELLASVQLGGTMWSFAETRIKHDHIENTTLLRPARVRLASADIKPVAGSIGYVTGAGDRVAESLRRMGVQVQELDGKAIATDDLSAHRAILIGSRAYNVHGGLAPLHKRLLKYVHNGGTLVMQYQTNTPVGPLPLEQVGPYPMTISRDRITDEHAAVRLLVPEHPLLRTPHAIGDHDFAGWVQERGLYFASEWSAQYTPLFEMADPGEEPHQGALLMARYGKGTFIYTGLSFFRQLPAGVPGAFRLLLNLLAGATDTSATTSAHEGNAPPMGSWSALYLSVLGGLAGVILALYLLTRAYS